MKDNNDERIPYVSKELCEYLRERYIFPVVLDEATGEKINANTSLGYMKGVNAVLEYLEALQREQEGEVV